MEREKEEVAFKDFKSSVTVGEFEAVLQVAKREYKELKEAFKTKKKFFEKSEKDLTELESMNGMPAGLKDKLKKGFQRRAEKDFKKMLGPQLERHKGVVDFINRFRDKEELYAYLDQDSKETNK